jgi:hypothetical protein
MPFQPGNKLHGSRKGVPNRHKRDAREAIALFVDRNAHKLHRWLKDISEGRREPDIVQPDGTIIPGKWIVLPNPEKAFQLFQSVIEYHVPKLSRREVVNKDEGNARVIDSSQLTAEQRAWLREQLMTQLAPAQPLLEQQPAQTLESMGLSGAQVIDSVEESTEVRGDEG